MAATRLISLHVNKGKTIAKCLADRTDYSENEKKTENGKYISSYECDPKSCDQEFLLAKREYLHIHGFDYKRNVIAYQIRQSFKPGEVTPDEANRIGYETAMRWTKGNHAFIVATHVDRAHIHNHIIYNSTNLSCDGKWRNFFLSANALQKVSDLVCIEHGLSVIVPRPYRERPKYHNAAFSGSMRDAIRNDIEEALSTGPKNFIDLLNMLEAKDYEIRQGKTIAFRKTGNKRFFRIDTLGPEYSEDNLKRRIVGEEPVHRDITKERDFGIVLDIQKIIEKNKGANYERWAKRYNMKQVAKAMCFIHEHGIKTFDELAELTDNATKRFDELSASIKSKQKRLEEIAETKRRIADFAKTRETYKAYCYSGYSKKYYEAHREEIHDLTFSFRHLNFVYRFLFFSHNKRPPVIFILSQETLSLQNYLVLQTFLHRPARIEFQAVGLTVSTVSKIEIGDRVPSIDTFVLLSDFFGVSLDYLVLGKEH
ncbi:MAG: relaxase/mobilization nuclease domain-containing protein [Lachnospiraceae bacterium]|nr:relaxase/mobilization nuclease domain-containing protein [Lachnospiraceae bacterium]